MYLYNSQEIKEWDAYTIVEENIHSHELMERAGECLSREFFKIFPNTDIPIHIFCGLGNNGGDGLVMARLLRNAFYKVSVYECRISNSTSNDFTIMKNKLNALTNIHYTIVHREDEIPKVKDGVIIDCLFGSGLNKEPLGLAKSIIENINKTSCPIVSIDIPSGMLMDVDTTNETIVKATYTLSIQNMKLPFLFSELAVFCGKVYLIDIGLNKDFNKVSEKIFVTKQYANSLIHERNIFSHKGNYGKALIISGKEDMIGASILSTKSILKSGVGYVYVLSKECNKSLFNQVAPEALIIDSVEKISNYKVDSIGVGQGLGVSDTTKDLLLALFKLGIPLILDADAINTISDYNLLEQIPNNSILTPHPKEFERLFGKNDTSIDRFHTQQQKSKQHQIYIVLKNRFTSISTPEGKIYFNSTGNPGMAKAGSGDALTGLITGLVAKIRDIEKACCLSVFLHGLAGDIASTKYSTEGFTISQLIECISDAWLEMKSH